MVRKGVELWMDPRARAWHGAQRPIRKTFMPWMLRAREAPSPGRMYYEIRNGILGRCYRGRSRGYSALRMLPDVV
jgi:hypothetical protein